MRRGNFWCLILDYLKGSLKKNCIIGDFSSSKIQAQEKGGAM